MSSLHKPPGQKEVGQINIDNVNNQIQNLTKQKLKIKVILWTGLKYKGFGYQAKVSVIMMQNAVKI